MVRGHFAEDILLKTEAVHESETAYRVPDDNALEQDHTRLLRIAGKWCTRYGLNPHTYAQDFLNDAIISLYENNCPADCPQIAYLITRIKQLVANHLKKKARQKTSSDFEVDFLERVPDNRNTDSEKKHFLKELSAEVLKELTEAAERTNYDEVQLLLMAYSDGHEKRRDVMEATGLSAGQYGAAKKRLETLIRNLHPEILKAVNDSIGGDVCTRIQRKRRSPS